jgi:hypothetical protein
MNGWIGYKSLGVFDVAAASMPFSRRLLVGHSEASGPVHVDVHVRSYDDSCPLAFPAPAPLPGRLPVGTILDCYV